MTYKKKLLSVMLLLSCGLILAMESDSTNIENKVILKKNKIKIDYKKVIWSNFDMLPNDIKKEIFDYIFCDINLNKYDLNELIKINNLKTVNKVFAEFLLKNYRKKILKILKRRLIDIVWKFKKDFSDEDLKKAKIIIESDIINLNCNSMPNFATFLMWAAIRNNKDIVKLLIKSGSNVDLQDCNGSTALMLACINNHDLEIVKLLLGANAKLNMQDNDGRTAIIYASSYPRGDTVVVDLLIKSGADLYIKNKEGKTAFDLSKTDEIRNILKVAMNRKIEKIKSDK